MVKLPAAPGARWGAGPWAPVVALLLRTGEPGALRLASASGRQRRVQIPVLARLPVMGRAGVWP